MRSLYSESIKLFFREPFPSLTWSYGIFLFLFSNIWKYFSIHSTLLLSFLFTLINMMSFTYIYEIYKHMCFFHIYLLPKNSRKLSKHLIKEHNENNLLLLLIFWLLMNNRKYSSNILFGDRRTHDMGVYITCDSPGCFHHWRYLQRFGKAREVNRFLTYWLYFMDILLVMWLAVFCGHWRWLQSETQDFEALYQHWHWFHRRHLAYR